MGDKPHDVTIGFRGRENPRSTERTLPGGNLTVPPPPDEEDIPCQILMVIFHGPMPAGTLQGGLSPPPPRGRPPSDEERRIHPDTELQERIISETEDHPHPHGGGPRGGGGAP